MCTKCIVDQHPPPDLTICPSPQCSATGFNKMTHNSSDYSQFLLVKPQTQTQDVITAGTTNVERFFFQEILKTNSGAKTN